MKKIILFIAAVLFITSCDEESIKQESAFPAEPALSSSELTKEQMKEILRASPAYNKWVFFESIEELLDFRIKHRIDLVLGGGADLAVKVKEGDDKIIAQNQALIEQDMKNVTAEDRLRTRQKFLRVLDAAVEKGEITKAQRDEYEAYYIKVMDRDQQGLNLEDSGKLKSTFQNSPLLAATPKSPVIDGGTTSDMTTFDIDPWDEFGWATQVGVEFTRPTSYTQRTVTDFTVWWSSMEDDIDVSVIGGEYLVRNWGCYVNPPNDDALNVKYAYANHITPISGGKAGNINLGTPSSDDYDPTGYIKGSSKWSVYFVSLAFAVSDNPIYDADWLPTQAYYKMGGNGDIRGGDAWYYIVEGPSTSDLERLLDLWEDIDQATAYEHVVSDVNQSGTYVTVADIMQLIYLKEVPDILCFNEDKFD